MAIMAQTKAAARTPRKPSAKVATTAPAKAVPAPTAPKATRRKVAPPVEEAAVKTRTARPRTKKVPELEPVPAPVRRSRPVRQSAATATPAKAAPAGRKTTPRAITKAKPATAAKVTPRATAKATAAPAKTAPKRATKAADDPNSFFTRAEPLSKVRPGHVLVFEVDDKRDDFLFVVDVTEKPALKNSKNQNPRYVIKCAEFEKNGSLDETKVSVTKVLQSPMKVHKLVVPQDSE